MFSNNMLHKLFGRKKNSNTLQIEVGQSCIHERGVFSKTAFKPGQLIEKAPVLLMNAEEKNLLQNSSLHHYYFLLNNKANPIAIGFGYTSLYNHAANANAVYNINPVNLSISISACKKIAAGEEITINYNGRPNDISTVHFSVNN